MKTRRQPLHPHATIDRFEDDVAVLVRDGFEEVRPLSELPEGAREGDVIDLETMQVDVHATEALRREVQQARERAGHGKPPAKGSFDL